jgi:hypothetical protein
MKLDPKDEVGSNVNDDQDSHSFSKNQMIYSCAEAA